MKHHEPELRERAWQRLHDKGRVGVKDAAYILNLHYTTVSDYVVQGKLPAITITNRFYIPKQTLLEFIAQDSPHKRKQPQPQSQPHNQP